MLYRIHTSYADSSVHSLPLAFQVHSSFFVFSHCLAALHVPSAPPYTHHPPLCPLPAAQAGRQAGGQAYEYMNDNSVWVTAEICSEERCPRSTAQATAEVAVCKETICEWNTPAEPYLCARRPAASAFWQGLLLSFSPPFIFILILRVSNKQGFVRIMTVSLLIQGWFVFRGQTNLVHFKEPGRTLAWAF